MVEQDIRKKRKSGKRLYSLYCINRCSDEEVKEIAAT